METLDFQFNLEQAIKDLLKKSEEIITEEFENYKQTLLSNCDKVIDQSKSQQDLNTSQIDYNNKITEIVSKQSEQEQNGKSLQQKKQFLENEIEALKNDKLNKLDVQKKKTTEKNEICQANDVKFQELKLETQNLMRHISMYKEDLGLEIRPLKNNRIQFVFNTFQTNSSDLAFVILQLNSRVYTILETEPELSNIKELEKKLNETNNLAGFIQSVRHCLFKK